MLKNPVIQTIKSRGLELWKGVEGLLNASGLNTYIRLTGYPARQIMEFRDREGREWWELKSLLQQEIHKRGIIFGGYHVISYSHKPSDIRKTLEIYKEVFDYVRECISKDKVRSSLKGKVVQPVFRKP
jgi:glutamate-1-semialdehyde aminotransferase